MLMKLNLRKAFFLIYNYFSNIEHIMLFKKHVWLGVLESDKNKIKWVKEIERLVVNKKP